MSALSSGSSAASPDIREWAFHTQCGVDYEDFVIRASQSYDSGGLRVFPVYGDGNSVQIGAVTVKRIWNPTQQTYYDQSPRVACPK